MVTHLTAKLVKKNKYLKDRNKISKYGKEYYKNNREEKIEYQRQNRDARHAYKMEWQKNHPEIKRVKEARRRALKISSSTTDPWELAEIASFYAKCPKGYHVDHILPLTLGGTHTLDNLQYLEAKLNLDKRDQHPDEWDDPRPISCRA